MQHQVSAIANMFIQIPCWIIHLTKLCNNTAQQIFVSYKIFT